MYEQQPKLLLIKANAVCAFVVYQYIYVLNYTVNTGTL